MSSEYDILVDVDPPYAAEVDQAALIAIARQVLASEGVAGPLEVGVWITNEDELHTLNRTYRNVDHSTDVLSFGEADDADSGAAPLFVSTPDAPRHLGDLAISYPHVVRQADEYNHSRARELGYLLTHGLLHLLGYDHEQSDDEAHMREREEVLLGALGITRDAPLP